MAAANGHSTEIDWEQWYLEKYGEAPEYSKILDYLAKTQSERQQLLRPYFEPNEQEREEGLKQPTAAHRAIARLVAGDHVKVIVTTNFDRLIERALEDEGVVPTVLSTKDQVQGALPLIHTKCCVFKVHGDYMDTRILNSPTELGTYPEEYDRLLDRILDDFGLIVCGWSAEWDEALSKALTRATSRRFTTYWGVRGKTNDQAQHLIAHRQAQVVPIRDADAFFETIQQTVNSIEEYSGPHPLSTEAAVGSLKRYLSGPEHRIQLLDLIDSAVDQVVEATSGEGFEVQGGETPTIRTVTARIRKYESASSTLTTMAATAGFWAEDGNILGWGRAMERFFTTSTESGYSVWNTLRMYPGILATYALGIGAVESERVSVLKPIFEKNIRDDNNTNETTTVLTKLAEGLSPFYQRNTLEGFEKSPVAISDWLHEVLRQPLNGIIANDMKYTYVFVKFEILVSLAHVHRSKSWWYPLGSFIHRRASREHVLGEIEESISVLKDDSPFVASGLFGEKADKCIESLKDFKEYMRDVALKLGYYWY